MEREKNINQSTLFPSNWTLDRSNRTHTAPIQETVPLGTYPRDWSLSTIQESIPNTPEVSSEGNAAGSEFSLARSDSQVPVSTISSPTFETSWTLPLTANLNQSTSTPNDEQLFLDNWSIGPIRRRPDEKETVTTPNTHDIVGTVPRHVVPHATPSSAQELITPSTGNSASVVPGNFRPSGYSNAHNSPQSDLLAASKESSSRSVNGMVRLPPEYIYHASPNSGTLSHSSNGHAAHVDIEPTYATTSASPSDHRNIHSLPSPRNNAVCQVPRPAAFVPDQTSPHILQNNPGLSQSYRLPQSMGFGPEIVTPSMSNTSDHSIQSPVLYPADVYLARSSPPIDHLHQNYMASFAPPDIPVKATVQIGDMYPWLSADGEQLYKVL
ncbi:hypothetical protein GGR55DRAFT_675584 [Xylaria sp. FL0064]|nr:hypothetical protein GGR55DRAFT_675584 [Xylaria sp. FL0064]